MKKILLSLLLLVLMISFNVQSQTIRITNNVNSIHIDYGGLLSANILKSNVNISRSGNYVSIGPNISTSFQFVSSTPILYTNVITPAVASAERLGYTLPARITGLTVGTVYWIDISVTAQSGPANTASIYNTTIVAIEQ